MEQIWMPDTCECVVRETWWRYFCTDCNYFNEVDTWCSYHNEYKPPSQNGVYQNCEHNTDEPQRVHTFKSFDHKCQWHDGLNDQAAYNRLKHDNWKKNDAITEFLEFMGYEGRWVEFRETYLDTSVYPNGWYYTGTGNDRICHFVMKGLNPGQINSLQRRIDNRIGADEIAIESA
jgi:hypothetical protein